MSRIQVFVGERSVPAEAGDGTRLALEALVPEAAPREGRLVFETVGVNFKNNRVLVNGVEIGYLQGPGYGKEARDYREAIPLGPGVLRAGLNDLVFVAGEDVSGAGVGAARDRFGVRDLWLEYEVVAARSPWPDPPTLGVAVSIVLVLVLLAREWTGRNRGPHGARS